MGDTNLNKFADSLKLEEGSVEYIYLDMGKHGEPTSGVGHVMPIGSKDYNKYVKPKKVGWVWKTIQTGKDKDGNPKYEKRKVAHDKDDNLITIDSSTRDSWLKEDAKEHYNYAIKQSKDLNISDENFIRRLAHVNYQQGPDWWYPKRFPNTWKALKGQEWQKAIDNIKWINPSNKQETSLWYRQSESRAEKFMDAISQLQLDLDIKSFDPDTSVVDSVIKQGVNTP